MGERKPGGHTRRRVLGTVGAGMAGMLAGCSGGGSDSGDDTPNGGDGERTTLRWPYAGDPKRATWFGTAAFPGPEQDPEIGGVGGVGGMDGDFERPGPAWDLTMALELWGPWLNGVVKTGDVGYGLYESVDVSPDRIEVTVREGAGWSNGDEVLGRDAVPVTMAARLTNNATAPSEIPASGPSRPLDAVTGFDWDGKRAVLESEGGWFEGFMPETLWSLLAREGAGWGGIWQHTRIEPYDAWFETIVDLWERAKEGAIDPWSDPLPAFEEIAATVHTERRKWEERFHEPGNAVVSGAFRPLEYDGNDAIVLERNPEFYAADRVGIDRLRVVRTPDARVRQMLLDQDRLDYFRGTVEAQVARSLPDAFEERFFPTHDGLAIAINHDHPLFAARASRRAVLAAIDTGEVAKLVHGSRYDPITAPGEAHRLRDLLGGEFVESTLEGYGRDRERAARLMREAGFAREGGTWVGEGGDPVGVELLTTRGSPTIVQAVASQLGSFGIEASWKKTRQQAFEQAADRGDAAAWPTDLGVGFALPAVGRLYFHLVASEAQARNWYAAFPDDQFDAAEYKSGRLVVDGPDDLGAFELRAPPVGEPSGDRRAWRPARLAWECDNAADREAYTDALRKLAWLYNWHVPVLPIANARTQHFFDTANFDWSFDAAPYEGVGPAEFQPEDVVGLGRIGTA